MWVQEYFQCLSNGWPDHWSETGREDCPNRVGNDFYCLFLIAACQELRVSAKGNEAADEGFPAYSFGQQSLSNVPVSAARPTQLNS